MPGGTRAGSPASYVGRPVAGVGVQWLVLGRLLGVGGSLELGARDARCGCEVRMRGADARCG